MWRAPAPEGTCGDRKFCIPGYSQAITATPELVFAGSGDGWLRILDTDTGALLWQVDTKQGVTTASGEVASGGSMSGGAAPVAWAGQLFVSSGYGFGPQMPGNLLLTFEVRVARGNRSGDSLIDEVDALRHPERVAGRGGCVVEAGRCEMTQALTGSGVFDDGGPLLPRSKALFPDLTVGRSRASRTTFA